MTSSSQQASKPVPTMPPMKRQQFKLFQTPLDLAHHYWKLLLLPGDSVIDATCGNGHDTLFLADLLLKRETKGQIIAIDAQPQAIAATKKRLEEHLLAPLLDQVNFFEQCHSSFPPTIEKESIALIVYNLGYLPGGNKQHTTLTATTKQSLEAENRKTFPEDL